MQEHAVALSIQVSVIPSGADAHEDFLYIVLDFFLGSCSFSCYGHRPYFLYVIITGFMSLCFINTVTLYEY